MSIQAINSLNETVRDLELYSPVETEGLGGTELTFLRLFYYIAENISYMAFYRDKYFLLCTAVAFVLVVSFVFLGDESSSGRVGIAHDSKQTSSGYTFVFDQDDGSSISCFSRSLPQEGLCEIRGSWSDDGSMFFVSSLNVLYRFQSTCYVRRRR